MTINFSEQKRLNERKYHNPVFSVDGKNYTWLEDAYLDGKDLVAIMIGEDNKLYMAGFDYDEERMCSDEAYIESDEIYAPENFSILHMIDRFSGIYHKYECDYCEEE